MDSNLLRQQQQQQQMNSGLLRYRSAPSSLFANFMDGEDDFIASHHRSSSPEAESMFARFMNCDSTSPSLHEIADKSAIKAEVSVGNTNNRSSQFMGVIEEHGSEQMMYNTPPPLPPKQQPSMSNHASNVAENVYRVASSIGLDHQSSQMKMGNSNLIRHSSSPAGLFANLNVENGYAVMRGMGNFGAGNSTNEAAASTRRLKNQMSYPSGPPSSSGLMSPISEVGSESIGTCAADGGSMGNNNVSNQYPPNFPLNSWDDSALENFTSLKRFRDVDTKMHSGLNSSETETPEAGNQTRNLTHHFSLPKTSAEMAAILQFQDSVPCKIRAKRGCATHPRSIAERVRRTRISERMRKLQELVPNMDKQTNTADMLDLAVEYIKELQKQVKKLNDNRANCTCSSKQKPY